MKTPIMPCLWFNGQAAEAAAFHAGLFPDARITADTGLTVTWEIAGQPFMGLNGGPEFTVNPSISFFWNSDSAAEIDRLWTALVDGGTVLMPLDAYPFSAHYGWVADRFGVNWQLMLRPERPVRRVVPSLLFTREACGRAEEALGFYASVFPGSSTGVVSRYPAGMEPEREGTLNYAELSLGGQPFTLMDSAQSHMFRFNEGVSLVVTVEDQAELDHYWNRLSEGGEEGRCGWLKDRFGISWQVVPAILGELMSDPASSAKVVEAFMPMGKLDIATLRRAAGK